MILRGRRMGYQSKNPVIDRMSSASAEVTPRSAMCTKRRLKPAGTLPETSTYKEARAMIADNVVSVIKTQRPVVRSAG